MIKNTINIKDYHVLGFFFPNFTYTDDLSKISPKVDGVIYTGKFYKNLLDDLEQFKSYISLVPVPKVKNIDLNSPKSLIDWVLAQKGIELKEKSKSVLIAQDWDSFLDSVKILWVSGKLVLDKETKDFGIYELFKIMPSYGDDILRHYFKLLETRPVSVVNNALTTFFVKVIMGYPGSSESYDNILCAMRHNNQKYFLAELIAQYVMNNHTDMGFILLLVKWSKRSMV